MLGENNKLALLLVTEHMALKQLKAGLQRCQSYLIKVNCFSLHYSILNPHPLLSWEETFLNRDFKNTNYMWQVGISKNSILEFELNY